MEDLKVPTIMAGGRKRAILTQDAFHRRFVGGLPEGLERHIAVAGMTWRELADELGVCAGSDDGGYPPWE